MTDDTLRVECEKLLAELLTDSPVDRTQRLLAFARAQQAKAWEEAARLVCKYNCDHNHGKKATKACDDLETMFIEKSQATAREKAQVPYPGWCRQPDQCQGKSSCPLDPTCAD